MTLHTLPNRPYDDVSAASRFTEFAARTGGRIDIGSMIPGLYWLGKLKVRTLMGGDRAGAMANPGPTHRTMCPAVRECHDRL